MAPTERWKGGKVADSSFSGRQMQRTHVFRVVDQYSKCRLFVERQTALELFRVSDVRHCDEYDISRPEERDREWPEHRRHRARGEQNYVDQ